MVRGPVIGPFGGQRVELWLRDGEPAVAVLVGGDREDIAGLSRVSWSLGCAAALVERRERPVLIHPSATPGEEPMAREPRGRIDPVPAAVPEVVAVLVGLAERWRERILCRCLAGNRDWTERALNLAVEAPIARALLGRSTGETDALMRAGLEAAGVVSDAVPAGLLALAWDLHLARGVRLAGGDASVVARPPFNRAGPDRAVLRRFASWTGSGSGQAGSVLIPACGGGRLLLLHGECAARNNIHMYALDPDPRATLFATAVMEREFGPRLACSIGVAHPLVEAGFGDDPLGGLIPPDARDRLAPVDWSSLFGGVDRFDRVLIGNPALPLTRRTVVRRYIDGTYRTVVGGPDPPLLLVEAGARRLALHGRIHALYPLAAWRTPSAAALRHWLAPRIDVLLFLHGYCVVSAAAEPLPGPIRVEGLAAGDTTPGPYPRSALDPGSWTVADPGKAARIARLEAESSPLGRILLGGVRGSAPFTVDPALMIDRRDRRRLLFADRRAGRALRPAIAPADVTRFGSTLSASWFVVAGPLPRRATRIALELGVEPPETDAFPPRAGPRLLFAEHSRVPAFLWDGSGTAIPLNGVGTIGPADSFLAGLLQASLLATAIVDRCPDGLTARCLSRLPIRLPDPFDDRERAIRDEISAFASERLRLSGRRGDAVKARRSTLDVAIDRAVERLYRLDITPSP